MKKISFALKTFFYGVAFLFIFVAGLTAYIYQKEIRLKNKIYPNVFIDKINFGNKSASQIEDYLRKKNQTLKKVKIFLNYKNSQIASFSAEDINLQYDKETIIKHAFLVGRTSARLSRIYQKIFSILNLARFDFFSNLTYDLKPVEDVLGYLEEKYNQPAINALFEISQGRVSAFRKEKSGVKIDKEATMAKLKEMIEELKTKPRNNLVINVVDKIIRPEITLSSVNSFGIAEKLSEGKSDYSGSTPERIHNIILASSKLHGVLIPSNQIFSFNKTVGDISAATGYKQTYIIKNGRTVLGDGGGVCQVSTTLFRAALNAGLPIKERVAHAYRVHYYENDAKPGFDATVFSPSVDLKFENNTPAHILIQTKINQEKNWLIFILYGKRDNREVEISPSTVWDIVPPPEPVYQDDPTLKKGVIKQVDWPSWGAKAKFHYRVKKEGKVIIDQDFFSFYRPWRAVYLVGTAD